MKILSLLLLLLMSLSHFKYFYDLGVFHTSGVFKLDKIFQHRAR